MTDFFANSDIVTQICKHLNMADVASVALINMTLSRIITGTISLKTVNLNYLSIRNLHYILNSHNLQKIDMSNTMITDTFAGNIQHCNTVIVKHCYNLTDKFIDLIPRCTTLDVSYCPNINGSFITKRNNWSKLVMTGCFFLQHANFTDLYCDELDLTKTLLLENFFDDKTIIDEPDEDPFRAAYDPQLYLTRQRNSLSDIDSDSVLSFDEDDMPAELIRPKTPAFDFTDGELSDEDLISVGNPGDQWSRYTGVPNNESEFIVDDIDAPHAKKHARFTMDDIDTPHARKYARFTMDDIDAPQRAIKYAPMQNPIQQRPMMTTYQPSNMPRIIIDDVAYDAPLHMTNYDGGTPRQRLVFNNWFDDFDGPPENPLPLPTDSNKIQFITAMQRCNRIYLTRSPNDMINKKIIAMFGNKITFVTHEKNYHCVTLEYNTPESRVPDCFAPPGFISICKNYDGDNSVDSAIHNIEEYTSNRVAYLTSLTRKGRGMLPEHSFTYEFGNLIKLANISLSPMLRPTSITENGMFFRRRNNISYKFFDNQGEIDGITKDDIDESIKYHSYSGFMGSKFLDNMFPETHAGSFQSIDNGKHGTFNLMNVPSEDLNFIKPFVSQTDEQQLINLAYLVSNYLHTNNITHSNNCLETQFVTGVFTNVELFSDIMRTLEEEILLSVPKLSEEEWFGILKPTKIEKQEKIHLLNTHMKNLTDERNKLDKELCPRPKWIVSTFADLE